MNLDFSPEENAFRDEVRAFIKDNYPESLRKAQDEDRQLTKDEYLTWHKVLAKKGWVAPSWPREYGGPGWSEMQRYVFASELAAAGSTLRGPFTSKGWPSISTSSGSSQQGKVRESRSLPSPTLTSSGAWGSSCTGCRCTGCGGAGSGAGC